MKIKVIEEYEIDVCELCGERAKRDESFDICDCCGKTYCNSYVGVLFDENKDKREWKTLLRQAEQELKFRRGEPC